MTSTLADLRARPHDRDALLVHADWLQSQGDPRGELIAIEDVAATTADRAAFMRARAQARAFVLDHGELCPPAAGHAGAPQRAVWARWQHGFVRRLELFVDDPNPGDGRREFGPGPTGWSKSPRSPADAGPSREGWAELLGAIMDHPSMALVEHVLLRVDLRGEPLDERVIATDIALRGLDRWRRSNSRPPLQLDLWTQRGPSSDMRQQLRESLPELRPFWFSTDITTIPPPHGHPVFALEQALMQIDGGEQRFDLLWLDDRGQFLARLEARAYASWALDFEGMWQVHARRLAERRARSLFAGDALIERRVALLFDELAARFEPRAHTLAPRLAPHVEPVELSTAMQRLAPLSSVLPRAAEPVLHEMELSWYWIVEPCGQHRWCGVIGFDHQQLLAFGLIG